MNTASQLGPHTQKTEGRAPVLGSVFTTQAAHYGGGVIKIAVGRKLFFSSEKLVLNLFVVAFGPAFARAS
jgi:hypothetical protein